MKQISSDKEKQNLRGFWKSMTDPHSIAIRKVRVKNFRSLEQVEVRLSAITVLIGENNAGKTSFLDAIFAAIGNGVRHLAEEDIYLKSTETKPPREREIVVDLLVRPVDEEGNDLDAFPSGSAWLELWGNGIAQDDDDNDFVGMRMSMSWDLVKGGYYPQRRFLKEWKQDIEEMMDAEIAEQVSQISTDQIAPLSFYYLDAKRDAAEEMKAKGSIWNRLTSDHGLEASDVSDIEEKLTAINELVVSKSGALSHIQDHLHHVSDIVDCDKENISVNAVARRLRDLSKGVDVALSTKDAPQFPLSRQGMGTRSLTSVLLFRAYMTWRQKEQAKEALHPFVAVEEPETHLHPQAQRSLFSHLLKIPGQRIVSTHSPCICSQVDIKSFVHFFKSKDSTTVSHFYQEDEDDLDPESVRKINRQVMSTRGDLLFSRCVVLFEGETEEQALPQFAHDYWQRHPNDVGVAFVSVGGSNSYLPFLRLVTKFHIPWVIFSDGEDDAIRAIDKSLAKVGEVASATNSRCVVLPDKKNFEQYLATNDSLSELQKMMANFKIEQSAITNTEAIQRINEQYGEKTLEEILESMLKHKTRYGARVAQAFQHIEDPEKRIPPKIAEALDLAIPRISETENTNA